MDNAILKACRAVERHASNPSPRPPGPANRSITGIEEGLLTFISRSQFSEQLSFQLSFVHEFTLPYDQYAPAQPPKSRGVSLIAISIAG
jgi:hypothetical protein